jgi:hypothetical protein
MAIKYLKEDETILMFMLVAFLLSLRRTSLLFLMKGPVPRPLVAEPLPERSVLQLRKPLKDRRSQHKSTHSCRELFGGLTGVPKPLAGSHPFPAWNPLTLHPTVLPSVTSTNAL